MPLSPVSRAIPKVSAIGLAPNRSQVGQSRHRYPLTVMRAAQAAFLLAFLPRSVNERIYLRYLQTRARSEINALRVSEKVEFCVQDWRELRVHSFGPMADPITLMARYPLPAAVEFAGSNQAAR